MALYLGIDGGGVRTTAVAANEKGKILIKVLGGTIDYKAVGMATAAKNLKYIMSEVCAKTKETSFKCACIGSSALSSRASAAETQALVGGIIDAEKIVMDSSIVMAMECMTGTGPCALVISGVDSMVAARNERNKLSRAGGWGPLFGGEGSGFVIAMEAIRYAIRSFEGSEPKTDLLPDMLEFFDVYSPVELSNKLNDPYGAQRNKISSFAGRVFSCASAGDEAAKEIIAKQAKLLAGTTKNLVKNFPDNAVIGLWGGVFVNNRRFRNEFSKAMFEQSTEYRVEVLNYPAECGSLFAAYKLDNIPLSEELMKNIDIYRGVRV